MPLQIGQRPDHGFTEPLGLLSDCHRRIEHFLRVLLAIDREGAGGPLAAGPRAELEAALTYFATAAPNAYGRRRAEPFSATSSGE